jgi:hypothetical protein
MMELDGRSVTADELARLALYNYGHFTFGRRQGSQRFVPPNVK